MKKEFVVNSKNGDHKFEILFHRSDQYEDQKIEPEWYIQWNKKIEGIHYEMEILSVEPHDSLNFKGAHVHTSLKDNNKYVCWTGHVPTESIALLLTKMWCVGSVYSICYGDSFDVICGKHNVDLLEFTKMIEIFEKEYEIKLVE